MKKECGHHYARAKDAWSAILALSEFNYSAVDQKMSFTSKPGDYFWSTGYSWGTANVNDRGIVITVHHGKPDIKKIELKGRLTPFESKIQYNDNK